MATVSAACSLTFGWLIATSLALVVGVGLLYGFAALALALRSLLGYGAGAVAPLLFSATLDRLLHRTPEASARHRGSALRASAISEVAR